MSRYLFTPGPWVFSKPYDIFGSWVVRGVTNNPSCAALPVTEEDYHCRTEEIEICTGDFHDVEELEANMKLIAAAPELLGACEEALIELNRLNGNASLTQKLEEVISKALYGSDHGDN